MNAYRHVLVATKFFGGSRTAAERNLIEARAHSAP